MSEALSKETINEALTALNNWNYENDSLIKNFEFGDFTEAMSFLMRLAFYAESLNHHPEIWNVYNKVKLTLTTHDAGNKVTGKDLDLAKAIENFNWTHKK